VLDEGEKMGTQGYRRVKKRRRGWLCCAGAGAAGDARRGGRLRELRLGVVRRWCGLDNFTGGESYLI